MNTAKILLIEDDKDQVLMYQAQFMAAGLNIDTAFSGKSGLEKVRDTKPDIVLLDIRMYDMDGREVLRAIKKDKTIKNIPIVLLTNLAKKEIVEEGIKLGAADFIVKSQLDPSEVVKRVKKILDI